MGNMYLEKWNGGYWLSEFHIQTVRDEEPCINEKVYESIQYEVYPTGEQEDEIMVKVEQSHFEVEPDSGIPIGVLGLPQREIDELRIRNTPKKCPVLVVKPWFRDYLTWTEEAT